MTDLLNAAEAAARLGIKRETLYAYVSRGLLKRHPATDGRSSQFDAAEVDALRSGRKRTAIGELATLISTALTEIGGGKLTLRGRDLIRMVNAQLPYEVVAEWLWQGEPQETLPAHWPLAENIAVSVEKTQAALPANTPIIDRLRVTVAVASSLDPLRFDTSPTSVHKAARTLIRARVHGLPIQSKPSREQSIAHQLWARLSPRRGQKQAVAALDASLGLLVDHGLATSTLGARVAASVRADPYSVVGAGLGVVGGTLHGAASSLVHRMLVDAHARGNPAAAIGDLQRHNQRIPGVGHNQLADNDPRFEALMAFVRIGFRDDPRLSTIDKLLGLVDARSETNPNIDFALGSLTRLGDMNEDAGEGVFAIARTAGWLAHALEEFDEAPLRFRALGRYTGPPVSEGRE